jgi:hypothetical protein
MNEETQKVKEQVAKDFGHIQENGKLEGEGGFRKHAGMPWFLAYWYENGFEDDRMGTSDDIGYHATFKVDDAAKEEYSPDIPLNVVGYIVKENDQGFLYWESYETKEELGSAEESILTAYDEFFTCERCNHINYSNGDGCQVEGDDDPCTCQECGDNPCPHNRTGMKEGNRS